MAFSIFWKKLDFTPIFVISEISSWNLVYKYIITRLSLCINLELIRAEGVILWHFEFFERMLIVLDEICWTYIDNNWILVVLIYYIVLLSPFFYASTSLKSAQIWVVSYSVHSFFAASTLNFTTFTSDSSIRTLSSSNSFFRVLKFSVSFLNPRRYLQVYLCRS